MDNHQIAEQLTGHAAALEAEHFNLYRVRAYRRAADMVRALDRPLADLYAERGAAGLLALPGVGLHLAYTLEGLLQTGTFETLRPADAALEPERLVLSLPAVGSQTARVLRERLGVTTVEELARVVAEGRMSEAGLPPHRERAVRDALERHQAEQSRAPEPDEPTVADLLALDAEYRRQAEEHLLPTLTPRNQNPTGASWLPLLHTERSGWRCRLLFSNTALAHRLGRTRDWVVIYFRRGGQSGQRTIVTETRGDLRGRRVVRGRERACRAHYQQPAAAGRNGAVA